MQKRIGEQRDEVKISYLEALEPEPSVEETRIFSRVKHVGKGSQANGACDECGDSKQLSDTACDVTQGQWWERRLAK